jgi:hypothetical protein
MTCRFIYSCSVAATDEAHVEVVENVNYLVKFLSKEGIFGTSINK